MSRERHHAAREVRAAVDPRLGMPRGSMATATASPAMVRRDSVVPRGSTSPEARRRRIEARTLDGALPTRRARSSTSADFRPRASRSMARKTYASKVMALT